ncbi:sulfatase family protein [Pelagicoccus mobilis]|uniref:Sulfatase n=1 Tax=Pelagicoccus mobilis TaxID=415221 RepID=A0A934VNB5_9BACT|nr:sulfatase [Pelagicoccus mobilis]MBK1879756.1 sulfatase [Pelagicoccus mobilis]
MKFLTLLSLFALSLLAAANASEKPNFLFIIADDCTYRDLGVYGGQAYTPNLEKLASQGMKFERCFQTSPMCSPTRHTIYTGLYPVKNGAFTNHSHAYDHVKSIVHYLKPHGYRVALSGKSHVAPKSVFPFEETRITGEVAKEQTIIDMEAVDALMSDSAKTGKPFALIAGSNEPHTPWNKGKEFRSRYNTKKLKLRPYMVDTELTRKEYRNYLAEISFFDNEVGQLLELLEKNGHAENTMVVVVSEQGNNFPFAKWSCYDSGLQSGMIVRWPGKVEPGSATEAMVEYIDILPTFIEAAGDTPPEVLDGQSLMPVLSGETYHHKDYVYGLQTSRGIFRGPHHYGIRSVRDEKYKLIVNLDPDAEFYNTINRSGFFKEWQSLAAEGHEHAQAVVNRFKKRPAIELYDITKDTYEMTNLASNPEYAEVVERLSKQLESWMESQGDEGQETELAAFYRMGAGNAEYKAWAKENGNPIKSKQ